MEVLGTNLAHDREVHNLIAASLPDLREHLKPAGFA